MKRLFFMLGVASVAVAAAFALGTLLTYILAPSIDIPVPPGPWF